MITGPEFDSAARNFVALLDGIVKRNCEDDSNNYNRNGTMTTTHQQQQVSSKQATATDAEMYKWNVFEIETSSASVSSSNVYLQHPVMMLPSKRNDDDTFIRCDTPGISKQQHDDGTITQVNTARNDDNCDVGIIDETIPFDADIWIDDSVRLHRQHERCNSNYATNISSATATPSYNEWRISIVYNDTFQCPTLYFTVQEARTGVPLRRAVDFLHELGSTSCSTTSTVNVENFLSFDEHPITRTPCCFLHPCYTNDVLATLVTATNSCTASSLQYLCSWFTVMLPIVHLSISPYVYTKLLASTTANNDDGIAISSRRRRAPTTKIVILYCAMPQALRQQPKTHKTLTLHNGRIVCWTNADANVILLFGMSYTTFEYRSFAVHHQERSNIDFTFRVNATNTGSVTSNTAVLAFLSFQGSGNDIHGSFNEGMRSVQRMVCILLCLTTVYYTNSCMSQHNRGWSCGESTKARNSSL